MSRREPFPKDTMFYRFALYGFLKNLRLFEPFIILFLRASGLSFLQIGVLYSVRDISTTILEIPTGVVADSLGRRMGMVMSFVAYIISFLAFFFFDSFAAFVAAMILFAVGEAFRTGTHKALILEHLELNQMQDLKVEYYGRTRAASQLGSALNALLAAGLVFYTGNYRAIFLVTIIPYLIDLVNLATYPKELDGALSRGHHDMIGQIKTTVVSFLHLFRSPKALAAIGNSSGFDAFFKAVKDYLQPVLESFALSIPLFVSLQEEQRSAIFIGVVYSLIYLLSSVAARNASWFGERFQTPERAINASFVMGSLLLVGAGAAAWLDLAGLSIVIFLLLHLLHNVRRPLNVAVISDRIASQVMASGLSLESQVTTLFMAMLAPALGALADALGVGAALALLGVLMAFVGWLASVRSEAVAAEPSRLA